MRLSEALTDDIVVINKVLGHGSFRKRITEMGFVRGKTVKVIKNAPLKDPVEYQILGYNVTLRRSEASLIEVSTVSEHLESEISYPGVIDHTELKSTTKSTPTSKEITVALVGNPNCGKTTLFNLASGAKEHVGNYSGVTVDIKEAFFSQAGYTIRIVDLPGIYSLTPYTPEEIYARNYILQETPDVIINVIDATNLERNLYLTTQLIDMDLKVVGALNIYDELEKTGDQFDYEKFGAISGVPMVPTTASRGIGVEALFDKVIDAFEGREKNLRHIHINYGEEVEKSIQRIRQGLDSLTDLRTLFSTRYFAIKLLEKDSEAEKVLDQLGNPEDVQKVVEYEISRIKRRLNESSDTVITDAKYGFILGALRETYTKGVEEKEKVSDKIDRFLTHPILGLPIFFFFLFITFYSTFELGAYPQDWIEQGVAFVSGLANSFVPDGILKDLLIDGIINGLGSVIVFLPNIMILFFFTSLMEDTGYMARAAFIMDKAMHKLGLHGRSFIPMLMGFGCNVPAIMATRTIRNRGDRLLTMLIIPFMSCSARLPVYIVFVGAFFPENPAIIMFGLYLFGIVLAGLVAKLLNKTVFSRKETPFVMELPPYRFPTTRNIMLHMWDRASSYLKKIGGAILVAVILIWVLEYFPKTNEQTIAIDAQMAQVTELYEQEISSSSENKEQLTEQYNDKITHLGVMKSNAQLENSYLGVIGKTVQPIMAPLHFDWKMTVSLMAGVAAKEIVVSTMGVLYSVDEDGGDQLLQDRLVNETYVSGEFAGTKVYSPLTALAFLLFVLIYFPCVAVVAAIKKESGHWKYAMFSVLYTSLMAWGVAFLVIQIGGWLGYA